jgi:RNA polymerase sigma factor (sigma-70 family)
MDKALEGRWPVAQDQQISGAVNREYSGLRNFIRRRVPDEADAEDILHDVFRELIEAYRMMKPIEQVTAWLFRVARNRIIDLFRRKRQEGRRREIAPGSEDGSSLQPDELPAARNEGPEAFFIRKAIAEELDAALDELPDEQREVFVAHELMGYSFREISLATGVGVNTLLSRKHYAVLHLRRRLQSIYDQFMRT